jgi:hypothetical protein
MSLFKVSIRNSKMSDSSGVKVYFSQYNIHYI